MHHPQPCILSCLMRWICIYTAFSRNPVHIGWLPRIWHSRTLHSVAVTHCLFFSEQPRCLLRGCSLKNHYNYDITSEVKSRRILRRINFQQIVPGNLGK